MEKLILTSFMAVLAFVQIGLSREEKQIQGTLKSISVAKKTGEFVIASIARNSEGVVHFFSSNGVLLWQLKSPKDAEMKSVGRLIAKISSDGNSLLVNWMSGHFTRIQLYDRNRNLLFNEQWTRGFFLEGLANDGSFLFHDTIYLPDGTTQKINYPAKLQIPPYPVQTLIRKDRIVLNAVTSTDTIYSKAKLNAKPKGKKRSGRRPPRGILRFDREDVLLLIDSNGSILFERQLASPQTSIVRLADSFLIETKNQKDVRLIRMDYSGNVLWQREHPAKHISDNYWSDSAGYILMASTYSPRGFVVLDKDNGNLIGSKQFEKGYSIGPVMDMFYNKNKVYVSGLSRSPQGKTQFRTRIMELDENSSMKNLIDKKGLMIELSGGNNFLIYQSDSEQFSKREGLSSNDFKIELVNELPINGN